MIRCDGKFIEVGEELTGSQIFFFSHQLFFEDEPQLNFFLNAFILQGGGGVVTAIFCPFGAGRNTGKKNVLPPCKGIKDVSLRIVPRGTLGTFQIVSGIVDRDTSRHVGFAEL